MSGTGKEAHENVVRIDRRNRRWNGVLVIDVHEHIKGEVLHQIVNDQETGLAIALDEVGGTTEPRLRPGQACSLEHHPNHMTLVPKGMTLWGFASKELRFSRYAILSFDLAELERRFQGDFKAASFESPRLRFFDKRIHSLIRMLVDTLDKDDSTPLLGDSLTAAIFALLTSTDGHVDEHRKLPQRHLSLAMDYMNDQLPRQIELKELARLVGLSQWHFCRAFKVATGVSPYQWQLDKRIELVRTLLIESDATLEVIAKSAGFGDSMHLIRTFKGRTGQTPGAWRRNAR
jgi:AraC family transcriptional regulator